jgi:hypothetical protein
VFHFLINIFFSVENKPLENFSSSYIFHHQSCSSFKLSISCGSHHLSIFIFEICDFPGKKSAFLIAPHFHKVNWDIQRKIEFQEQHSFVQRMNALYILIVFISVLVAVVSQPPRRRESKQVEEKVKNMNPNTKQRILAMQAARMPKEAIAQKVSYEMGGVGAAHRVIDGVNAEQARKKAQRRR